MLLSRRATVPFSAERMAIKRLTLPFNLLGPFRARIQSERPERIDEKIDPEIYDRPRNFDIFPETLAPHKQDDQRTEPPRQYTLTQLRSTLQRAHRGGDDVDNIYVSTAWYCKQTKEAEHEFLLFKVSDCNIPKISNFLVLDRTAQTLTPSTSTAISTSISSNVSSHDRLRVSCYGDRESLVEQCGLGPYEVLERLEFPVPTSCNPLRLYELGILALTTSQYRRVYNIISSQCFWFAGCIWEGMRALSPEAICVEVAKKNTRGKFGSFFRQNLDVIEISDITYRARYEIRLFRVEISRGKAVSFYALGVSGMWVIIADEP
ncbi:hypothetical protein BDV93DRAFT_180551 [Ceratobasidium sp. AG-I]|nr:hypothetical protein BDV93DRAFT_180551 [Ceratobasidium sp. AG-I]